MLTKQQQAEIDKYAVCYVADTYRMGDDRRRAAIDVLRPLLQDCATYLDVGCGRGELLQWAKFMGLAVAGTEVVHRLCRGPVSYAVAWDLPRCADLVTCLDVLEHLLPDDTERTLVELDRVAQKHLVVTASNKRSIQGGVELHVNRRPYDEWDALLRQYCSGTVHRIETGCTISETWWVDYTSS